MDQYEKTTSEGRHARQPRHARHAKYALLLSFIWVP